MILSYKKRQQKPSLRKFRKCHEAQNIKAYHGIEAAHTNKPGLEK